MDRDNLSDPLCPALAAAAVDAAPGQVLPLLDPSRPLAKIPPADLPSCPRCRTRLLRPGVVWFGEGLDEAMLAEVDKWVGAADIDLMLVIGTSAVVHPAASYIYEAQQAGARIVTVNLDADDSVGLDEDDFAFVGDAAALLPELLEPVIGKMRADGTFDE